MPNESISCPNCGASDVRQSTPESYVCKHCQANFRWVDPTKVTVAHKPTVCVCGNFAEAFCVRCQSPLCGNCKKDWIFFESMLPERALAARRVPMNNCILCSRCKFECREAVREITEDRIAAADRGRACRVCFSESVRGRCYDCGVGLCSTHAVECGGCGRTSCDKHLKAGPAGQLCGSCISRWKGDKRAEESKKFTIQLIAVLGVAASLIGFCCILPMGWLGRTGDQSAAPKQAANQPVVEEKPQSNPAQPKTQTQLLGGVGAWLTSGETRIRIDKASIGKPTFLTFGGVEREGDVGLIVVFSVENASKSRPLSYRRPTEGFTATDSTGRELKLRTVRGVWVKGEVFNKQLAPGEAVADILVFDPPSADATHIDLVFPAVGDWSKGGQSFRLAATAWRE